MNFCAFFKIAERMTICLCVWNSSCLDAALPSPQGTRAILCRLGHDAWTHSHPFWTERKKKSPILQQDTWFFRPLPDIFSHRDLSEQDDTFSPSRLEAFPILIHAFSINTKNSCVTLWELNIWPVLWWRFSVEKNHPERTQAARQLTASTEWLIL